MEGYSFNMLNVFVQSIIFQRHATQSTTYNIMVFYDSFCFQVAFFDQVSPVHHQALVMIVFHQLSMLHKYATYYILLNTTSLGSRGYCGTCGGLLLCMLSYRWLKTFCNFLPCSYQGARLFQIATILTVHYYHFYGNENT